MKCRKSGRFFFEKKHLGIFLGMPLVCFFQGKDLCSLFLVISYRRCMYNMSKSLIGRGDFSPHFGIMIPQRCFLDTDLWL